MFFLTYDTHYFQNYLFFLLFSISLFFFKFLTFFTTTHMFNSKAKYWSTTPLVKTLNTIITNKLGILVRNLIFIDKNPPNNILLRNVKLKANVAI